MTSCAKQGSEYVMHSANLEFSIYLGKEVRTIERKSSRNNDTDGERVYHVTDPQDPTLLTLENEILAKGSSMLVLFPWTVSTCDYRLDRVRVYLDKGLDGTYVISHINRG